MAGSHVHSAWVPPGAEQTGAVVALDAQNGKRKTIYGMGRHNHENDVAIPGYDDLAVLSGDDTFFTTPLAAPYKTAWSQLYSYIAPDTDALWNDEGDLLGLRLDNGRLRRLLRLRPHRSSRLDHRQIREGAEERRDGQGRTGEELLSTDFPGMRRRQP